MREILALLFCLRRLPLPDLSPLHDGKRMGDVLQQGYVGMS